MAKLVKKVGISATIGYRHISEESSRYIHIVFICIFAEKYQSYEYYNITNSKASFSKRQKG